MLFKLIFVKEKRAHISDALKFCYKSRMNDSFFKLKSGVDAVSINITDKLIADRPGLVLETEFNMKEGLAATIYTDYESIAVRYSCNIIGGNQLQEYFYIMTRSRGFNDMTKFMFALDQLKKIPANISNLQLDLVNDLTCGSN